MNAGPGTAARMTLKVFVSSTKEDLPDCRRTIQQAVILGEALPVMMENWPAEYLPALDLVRQKIDESTHYFGLFAYRRGWVPNGQPISITEEEFNHARTRLSRQHMTIFLPLETSEIAMLLHERAKALQDLSAEADQVRFLERVREMGVVQHFETLEQLGMHALFHVMTWNRPLLEQKLARAREKSPPTRQDLAQLGHAAQETAFRQHVLDPLLARGGPPAAAAVIAGPPGHGQDHLQDRLCSVFEAVSNRFHTCSMSFGQVWRGDGLTSLLRTLGSEAGLSEPPSTAAAAAHLRAMLEQKDVILRVKQAQHFAGGLPGFVDAFWRPLLRHLPPELPYRLLCLITHEGSPGPHDAWAGAVRPCGDSAADPADPLLLPPVESFTAADLESFIRKRLGPEHAPAAAARLLADTGGMPALLYTALSDPLTWNHPNPDD